LKKYFIDFLNRIDASYPEFINDCNRVIEGFADELNEISKIFRQTKQIECTLENRKQISEKSGINLYTVNMLSIIVSSKWLFEDYKSKGISEDIFYDTMKDIKYKLIECKQVKGVYGTFVEGWYNSIFEGKVIQLGRFAYEKTTFGEDTPLKLGDYVINKDDVAYSIHIPSSGPMPLDVRLDSYKKAYEFFGKGKPVVLMCRSWLIFSKNKEIFPPHLNLVSFGDDFRLLWDYADENYANCWRIFGVEYDGNPDNLPYDNTPRRAMVDYLKKGGVPGGAKGVFVYDGQNIIK